MEWNSKWDWENLILCGPKTIESPKKLQLADWMVVDDTEIDAGSFNLSSGCGNSRASGSDSGHVNSAKSSISASTDSSTKEGMQTPSFRLMSFGAHSNYTEKMEMEGGTELLGASLQLDSSLGSGEQWIGLKLGKRTYFENIGAGGNTKSASVPVMPTPSPTPLKKSKLQGQELPVPRCLVEGCNIDLSTAKEYHRKHRVCDSHSKCPKVIVGGLERRFCQQCSRFHSLAEFDEKKRSCRRRLSDHNARRRKPQQETIQFNSTRMLSPFYEGRQQMSFLLNNGSLMNSRSTGITTWNSSCNSKFIPPKVYPFKLNGDGCPEKQINMHGIKLPPVANLPDTTTNGFLALRSSTTQTLNPGSKGTHVPSHINTAPEYSRALSLLSTDSWGSCGPVSIPNGTFSATQTTMDILSSELWPAGNQPTQPLTTSNNFPEMQSLKAPYEADFFSNILN